MYLKVFIATVVLAVVAGAGVAFFQNKEGGDVVNLQTPFPQKQTNETQSDWKTFQNTEFGLQFKYPPTYILEEKGSENSSFLAENFSISIKTAVNNDAFLEISATQGSLTDFLELYSKYDLLGKSEQLQLADNVFTYIENEYEGHTLAELLIEKNHVVYTINLQTAPLSGDNKDILSTLSFTKPALRSPSPAASTLVTSIDSEIQMCINSKSKDTCLWELAKKRKDVAICSYASQGFVQGCYSGIAVEQKDANLCKFIESEYQRDACYKNVSIATDNLNICSLIYDSTIKGICTDTYYRKHMTSLSVITNPKECEVLNESRACYEAVAKNTKNEQTCKLIKIEIYESERDGCYFGVADAKRDPNVCDLMSEPEKIEACKTIVSP